MKKQFLVPVAYWISESGSSGAWPEVVRVLAENEHDALMETRKFLIERDRDPEDPNSEPAVWYYNADRMEGDQSVPGTTYGVPDEEGYIMGDPQYFEQLKGA